jgi:type II secretory ATPase GspE/PulE/Tfp pilus assembly ATPase PilB-like protein
MSGSGAIPLSLDELGMSPETLKAFKDVLSQPHGVILVTGPTGSGKTTTLYAALSAIDSPKLRTLTIEDPPWLEIPGAVQGTVRDEIGLTIAEMLRAAMRSDPDVVMVDELRDEETVDMCLKVAVMGHLVLSVLHANDAAGGLTHLLDTGVEPVLIANTVKAILAQRLVRMLCSECKEAVDPSEELRQIFVECRIEVPDKVYKAVGCDICKGKGYKGRTAIHELLVMNEELKGLVEEKAAAEEVFSAARKAGMRTLREDAMSKLASGIISFEEGLGRAAVEGRFR